MLKAWIDSRHAGEACAFEARRTLPQSISRERRDPGQHRGVARFRAKLLAAMMLIVRRWPLSGFTCTTQDNGRCAGRFAAEFPSRTYSLHNLRNCATRALAERCARLARNREFTPPSKTMRSIYCIRCAKDELRRFDEGESHLLSKQRNRFNAKFYRFLDGAGAFLTPRIRRILRVGPEGRSATCLKK